MPLKVLPIMTNSPSPLAGAEVDVRQPPAAAPRAPLDAEDDEVEGVRRLDLLPRPPAPARRVGRVEGLDHRPLLPGGEGVGDGLLRLRDGRADDAGDQPVADDLREHLPPRRQRLVDEIDAVAVQAVEEPGLHGARAEPLHRLLERPRPAVLGDGEGLAVEHDGLDGQGPGQRDDLRDAVGDLPQRPRPHPHLVAAPVHLDAGAVELVLDHDPRVAVRRAQLGQRGVQGVAGRGEHGPQRAHDLEADGAELGDRVVAGQRHVSRGREAARQHEGAAYGVGGHLTRRVASLARVAAAATASIMIPSSAP